MGVSEVKRESAECSRSRPTSARSEPAQPVRPIVGEPVPFAKNFHSQCHGFHGMKHTKMHASPQSSRNRRHSLSRQGHSKIAHRFSGGTHECKTTTAPAGATVLRTIPSSHLSRRHCFRRLLPSLAGLRGWFGIALPPLKRWAILGCPWRDKARRSRRKAPHWKPCPSMPADISRRTTQQQS